MELNVYHIFIGVSDLSCRRQ